MATKTFKKFEWLKDKFFIAEAGTENSKFPTNAYVEVKGDKVIITTQSLKKTRTERVECAIDRNELLELLKSNW